MDDHSRLESGWCPNPYRTPKGGWHRYKQERRAIANTPPACNGTWQSYGNGTWGVRITDEGRPDTSQSGKVCRVTNRNGEAKKVRLGAIVDDRSNCTIYAVAR
jgi:hypothetical protein